LNFSGSDWCSPCIRLKREIFESETFKKFADSSLVLVNADFPRLKKNQLAKDQVAKNESLAGEYNREGKFPFTLLLDEEGKIIKSWEGVPNYTPSQWINTIKSLGTTTIR
jgi:thioredoxin-related protein